MAFKEIIVYFFYCNVRNNVDLSILKVDKKMDIMYNGWCELNQSVYRDTVKGFMEM